MTPRPPLAEQLDLSPHPEGGWFRETWRSPLSFSPEGYRGPRSAATAIYFLLHPGEESRWHVVRSDELWFWHSGGPLELRLGGPGDEPSARRAVLLGGDPAPASSPRPTSPAAYGNPLRLLATRQYWSAASWCPASTSPTSACTDAAVHLTPRIHHDASL